MVAIQICVVDALPAPLALLNNGLGLFSTVGFTLLHGTPLLAYKFIYM
jgi:hypothetical protein